MGVGVNVSKLNLYAVAAPPVGVNVSKLVMYAVIGPVPLLITCGSPEVGIVGTAYTHTFPITGGTAPYTITLASGSLPPGLTLDLTTGVLSGTPTLAGTYIITLDVADSNTLTASVTCTITVYAMPRNTIANSWVLINAYLTFEVGSN